MLNEEANACVNVTDCPKGESCECHMNITLPPDGETCRVSVLMTKLTWRFSTVPLYPLSAECPTEGQEYYDGVNTCVPCTGTCADREPVCTLECRSGCGCPVDTVLDEEANACVNVTDCPRGE